MKELYEEARRSTPYQYGGQRYYRLKIVSILEFRKESPSTRSIQWILQYSSEQRGKVVKIDGNVAHFSSLDICTLFIQIFLKSSTTSKHDKLIINIWQYLRHAFELSDCCQQLFSMQEKFNNPSLVDYTNMYLTKGLEFCYLSKYHLYLYFRHFNHKI